MRRVFNIRQAGWVVLSLATACTSETRLVKITSDPAGAIVYVNGLEKGPTPTTVSLDFGDDPERRMRVQLRCKGFRPVGDVYRITELPEGSAATTKNFKLTEE